MPGLVTVTFPSTSGKPEDAFTNTFAFNDDVTVGTTRTNIQSDLVEFYAVDTGVAGTLWTSVQNMFSESVSRTAPTVVRFYDLTDTLDGSPHGSPVGEFTWSGRGAQVGTITGHLPEEMAIVLSVHADTTNVLESGPVDDIPTPRSAINMGAPATHEGITKPRARRRGRLYIGPLIADTGGYEGTEYHVMTSARDVLATAAARLMNSSQSHWGIWSRRDAAVREITGGFVDNAFDVQRRRGRKASARTNWGA